MPHRFRSGAPPQRGTIGEGEGMARKKDQAARRQQLVSATIELIADRGKRDRAMPAHLAHSGLT